MSSKLIFLLLTALLLVQCSVGKPMPDADTAAEVSKEEETKKESDAGDLSDKTSEENSEETSLPSFLFGEMTEMADLILNSLKKVMEDVVADINAMEDKSEALKIKTDKLAELVSKLDEIDLKNKKKMGWTLTLLDKVNAFRDMLNTTATEKPNEKPDAETLIFEASFKKNGIEKVVKDIKVRFVEFIERLVNYLDSLSPEVQKSSLKEITEFNELFMEESNFEKRIMLFHEFFEMNGKKPKNQEKKM